MHAVTLLIISVCSTLCLSTIKGTRHTTWSPPIIDTILLLTVSVTWCRIFPVQSHWGSGRPVIGQERGGGARSWGVTGGERKEDGFRCGPVLHLLAKIAKFFLKEVKTFYDKIED